MMHCSVCKTCREFHSITDLLHHLRFGHGIADYGQTISCGQGACARTFESFSGLRRHFKRCHQEGENGNDHDAPVQGDLDLHDEDDGDISIDEDDIDTVAGCHLRFP